MLVRQILPATPHQSELDHDDLVDRYRHPSDRPWVRANMVTSLDGSAVVDGRAKGLGSPADKTVFDLLRGLADVVLVGAGTARTEGYRALRLRSAYADLRAAEGQAPVAAMAVVSSRLELDPASELFGGPARTILITHARADGAKRAALSEVADVVVAGETGVDVVAAVDQLAERGLRRVLCEGGPSLLGYVAAAGLLDELCLTIAPMLVGGPGTRIVKGGALMVDMTLGHLLESDGVLLSRWTVAG